MRLATLRTKSGSHAVRVEDDHGVVLDASDVGSLLRVDDWRAVAAAPGPEVALDLDEFLPVVPRPTNILCVGLNFVSHAAEIGADPPNHPSLFSKFSRSLIGPRDPMMLPHPSMSTQGDWEVELVAIVGRGGRNIPVREAGDHLAGYAVGNDGSVRDWQSRNRAPLAGKGWEGMTPLGPWLTTCDDIDVGDLEMTCEVDDVAMQRGVTSDVFFTPEEIVSYSSNIVTLEPGDVIFLGTPTGTAMTRQPSPWLRPGQVVRSSIAGLGELINVCEEGPAPRSDEWTRGAGRVVISR
jgi:acylpyruvate hydrolase